MLTLREYFHLDGSQWWSNYGDVSGNVDGDMVVDDDEKDDVDGDGDDACDDNHGAHVIYFFAN